jgi:hypothetical protein
MVPDRGRGAGTRGGQVCARRRLISWIRSWRSRHRLALAAALLAAGPAFAAPISPATPTASISPATTVTTAPATPAPATAAPAVSEKPPQVLLSHATVPATREAGGALLSSARRWDAILSVDRFGRYSIRAQSRQGSSLAVVDRMAGPLAAAGEPGTENGRVDLFLDRGDYKLLVESHAKGSGEAKLEALPFRDLHPGPGAPRLVERKLVQDDLGDLEQLSYWLQLDGRGEVRLEAAGRFLADLRLWRDGGWLEETRPRCDVIQPAPGQPLLRCEIAAVLSPGLYRLTAYGGPSQPWAEDAPSRPFYLRWGAPDLPEAGRRRYQISPFGEDRYRLPAKVNYVRLELPEALPAQLAAGWLGPGEPFFAGGEHSAQITKKSLPPVAEVEISPAAGEAAQAEPAARGEQDAGEAPPPAAEPPMEQEEAAPPPEGGGSGEAAPSPAGPADASQRPRLWVAVRGTPGQPYVLQHFDLEEVYHFSRGGRYWISTVHTGHPEDSVDATAVLTYAGKKTAGKERLAAAAAIPLDAAHRWARRFNLLEPLTLFLEVREQGSYEVVALAPGAPGGVAGGAVARYRIAPFVTFRPERYEPPPFADSGAAWDLAPGFYVLEVEPSRRGVLDLEVRPKRAPGQLREAQGESPDEAKSVQASVRFGALDLDPELLYTLYYNRQPGVRVGAVVRRWPVDLDEALPLALRPGESFSLDFVVSRPGTLRALAEDGSPLEVSLDGAPWQQAAAVPAGSHAAAVRLPAGATGTTLFSLWAEPAAEQAATPLPPLPATALAALPQFPVLRVGAQRFFDLERKASATFLVQADRPALYQVQTTGLLATAGTLRTRTVTSLAHDEGNGVGRNVLLGQYLREGDYQVTVTAKDRSRGHLGIGIERTPLIEGGELRLGVPERISLPAGQAVGYRFTIEEDGEYRLVARGLGFVFRCRLEDAGGWPLEPPNGAAEMTRKFAPGTYRLVLLPQPVPSRALTLLGKKKEPLHLAGHGPHELPLSEAMEHVWREPAAADAAERPPDLWRFTLPAPAHVTIRLDEEMEGTLARLEPRPEPGIGQIPPGRSFTAELTAGRYEIAARCSRRNSLVRYHVRAETAELLAGQTRAGRAPAEIPVAVGRDGLVEISSYAPADVRARLFDAAGRLVADEDDRPDDWNFLIFQRLAAGAYKLRVEPVGSRGGPFEVSMRMAEEVEERPLALPFHGSVRPGAAVRLYPLEVPAGADLLLVAARSGESLGLAVEVLEGGTWRTAGTAIAREPRLAVPIAMEIGPPGDGGGGNAAKPRRGEDWRLRLWSLDGQALPARLSAIALASPRSSERELRGGITLAAVAGSDPPLAAAVDIERPGLVRLAAPRQGSCDQCGLRVSGQMGAPLAPFADLETATGGVVTVTGNRLWLVQELRPRSAAARVSGERVTLASGLDAPVRFQLPAGAIAACDLAAAGPPPEGQPEAAARPVLVLASATAGQPVARIGEREGLAHAAGAATRMAVADRQALAVALHPRQPVAQVWASQADLAAPPEMAQDEIQLSQITFPPPPPAEAAGWGVHGGTLADVAARRFDLPAGAKGLRLSIGEATVAVLSAGDEVLTTHWQGGQPFEEVLDGAATRLTLLHTRGGSDPFTFELLPRSEAEGGLVLDPLVPVERVLDRAGTLRLRLPEQAPGGPMSTATAAAARPWRVHVRGAGAESILLDGAGQVARGDDLAAGPGGSLLIRHGTGTLLAWLSPGDAAGRDPNNPDDPNDPNDPSQALWPRDPLPAALPIKPPATVPLAGRFAHLSVLGAAGSVLHLRMASPAVTLVRAGRAAAAPWRVEVHPRGVSLDIFLPAGEAELGLRALAGVPLSGLAELTTTPVVPIGEGLGPEVLLPAGGTRYFSFHAARPGPIGIGVKAGSDVVEASLLDGAGRPLRGAEHGLVQMPELPAAGDYLLVLHSPAAAPPVRARPALAGLTLPDTGPPADVVRRYLEEAGVAVPADPSGSLP